MFRSLPQTFVFALGFTLLGVVLAAVMRTPTAQAQSDGSGPLRHVVLFKFKDDATKEQVAEIVKAFSQLPQKIDGITAYEWGTDISPEKLADGFTHCFVVTFASAKSRDAYLPHKAHQDFVAVLKPHLDKVLVVDYFAKK
jgi:quinol monooxygenase YgiN